MSERDTTAGVLVSDGRYLVAQRKKGGPLSLKWEFIGGKRRYGESLEETLKREWMEEVSLEIEVGDFLVSTTFTNKGVHYTLYCFLVSLKGDSSSPSLNVHERVKWVSREEMKALDFGESDSVIRDYLLSCVHV